MGGALVVAAVVFAAAWYLMPSLEASSRRADREAAVHVERARRLLHQYDANLDYQALLVTTLRDLGVEADNPEDLTEDGAVIYEDSHTKLWDSYKPTDGMDPPIVARANYSDIDAQIREGVQAREQLIRENDDLLSEAAQEIDQALSVSSGDADAPSRAEAIRLKSIVEYYEGLALRLQAGLVRNEAQDVRRELAELAGRVGALKHSQTILDNSGIDDRIVAIREQLAMTTGDIHRREGEVTALDGKIGELEQRIAAAKDRRDKARRALDQLRARGIDFSDANGPADFAARITEQDRVYREAVREMESLVAGSYPYAKIDDTGDFVRGRYLENGSPANLTIEPGLTHYQHEREVAAAELERARTGLEGLQDGVDWLNQLRERLVVQQREAQDQVASLKPDATEIFDSLLALEEEAEGLEDKALDKLTASARTARDAAAQADNWKNDASVETQSLSPEKMERSAFAPRMKSGWMTGHIAAQGADADLAKAWVYYDRYVSAQQNAELFASLPVEFDLKDADADTERELADEARDAGVEAITEAHDILQKAHREADRQWTFVAEDAGAKYLLALFGDDTYLADAIEAYREALKGRMDEPYVQRLAARLRQLETRQP